MKVYLLQHSYEKEIGEDLKVDETKIIGIYSSLKNAEQVKREFSIKQGFNKFSENCFYIDEYEVDKNHWTSGFVNSDEIEKDFELLTLCFNEWLGIEESPQESWNNIQYYNALCDISKEVYYINETMELAKYIQKVWIKRFGKDNKNFDEYIKITNKIQNILKLI